MEKLFTGLNINIVKIKLDSMKVTFELGEEVWYHKIIKNDGTKLDSVKAEITSKPWKLGHGEWVVKLKGFSGGISLNHIEKINHES